MKDPATPLGRRVGLYLFFLAHMTGFGALTFYQCYHVQRGDFWSAGTIALLTYVPFYLLMFGVDELLWLVVTSLLGVLMIYGWLETLALPFIPEPGAVPSPIATDFSKLPVSRHILPGAFLVMYEFMLRNLLIDLLGARHDERRARLAGWAFLALSGVQILVGALQG